MFGAMNRPREFDDTREHLLDTGEAVIRGKGFAAVGLAELLATAGVPKGSFYHYFRSKEGYGAELLERYFHNHERDMRVWLLDGPGTAASRLIGYFRQWAARHDAAGGQVGCLAVKLSAEVCDLSEAMRGVLVQGMARTEAQLAEAIVAGRQDGSLTVAADPDQLARSLHQLWIGAELLARVQRSAEPLHQALRQTESWLQTSGG